jgi:hypothetical protein
LSLKVIETYSERFVFKRYEVESDENRRAVVIEIGRRFLGIENEIKDHAESKEKTELNSLDQNNISSMINNQTNEKDDEQSLTDNDLVIDILNDEVVSQVKLKIQSKKQNSKDSEVAQVVSFYRFSKRTF